MRLWVWLNNTYWYLDSRVWLWLIDIGIVWPHSTDALYEVRMAEHTQDVYDEWKWERDHPDDRSNFDWSDPDAGYNIDWSKG
jgi:hypothetical protein